MALKRFDIVSRRGRDELYLVYQSDFLSQLETRLVVPLVERISANASPASKLHPLLMLGDREYLVLTHLAFAARVAEFGNAVDNMAIHGDAIRDAFDLLTTGF